MNKTSYLRFYNICLLILLLSLYTVASSVSADTPNIRIDHGDYHLDSDLQTALINHIEQNHSIVEGSEFFVSSQENDETGLWSLFSIVSMDGTNCQLEQSDHVSSKCVHLFLAHNNSPKSWLIGLYPSLEFDVLLNEVPLSLIDVDARLHLRTNNDRANNVLSYKFPWSEATWFYTQGWHSQQSGGDALDIGTSNSDKRILAAERGTITGICRISGGQSVNIKIEHDDGLILDYAHLKYSTLTGGIALGQRVVRGQVLGELWQGDLSESPCGIAFQNSTYGHIHWDFPNLPEGQSFTADGCTITMDHYNTAAAWNCNGVIINPDFGTPRLVSTNTPATNSCCGCARIAKGVEGVNGFPLTLFGDGSLSSNVFGIEPQQFPPDCAIAETEFVSSNQAIIGSFNWQDATDVDGEVVGYRVYWGEDANGVGDMFVTEPRYLPTERVADDMPVTRYLRISAEDNDGNRSAWHTVAVWEYDPVAPTGTVQINAGGQVVPMLGVDVRLDVQDEGSGVTEMRLSADGETWQDWEPFVISADWTLDNTTAPQTIYAQVRDAAGNVSQIMSASVTVDLSNDPPSSASYSVNCSAMTQGGSQTSSSSYSLRSAIGQPHAASEPTSNSYQVRSGFWGCVGDTTTVPTAITLQHSEARRAVPLVILLGVALVLAGGWWRLRLKK